MKLLQIALVTALVGLSACAQKPEATKAGLIQLEGAPSGLVVNGEAVPEPLLEAYARKRGWNLRDPGQRDKVNAQLGEMLAVAQEAKKRGLLDDASAKADLELERLNRLSGLLIARTEAETPITEDVLRDAYAKQIQATGAEEFHVSHILLDTPERAQQIIAALAAGAQFDDVVSGQAAQPGVRDAKDLGWVRRPQLPPALADAIANLAPGSYTPQPVQTDFGYHVAQLREKRNFNAPAFESVRDGIRTSLERQRALDLAAQIKANSKIETGK